MSLIDAMLYSISNISFGINVLYWPVYTSILPNPFPVTIKCEENTRKKSEDWVTKSIFCGGATWPFGLLQFDITFVARWFLLM